MSRARCGCTISPVKIELCDTAFDALHAAVGATVTDNLVLIRLAKDEFLRHLLLNGMSLDGMRILTTQFRVKKVGRAPTKAVSA